MLKNMTYRIMVVNLNLYVLNRNVLYLTDLFFTLNHLNIPTVNQLKYLGIIISENNCAPDLKRQMCKLYANVNMIIEFSSCSPDVKCFFYLNPTVLTCIAPYFGMIVLRLH